MLSANEANRRSNERAGASFKALLDEVENVILASCEDGRKCAVWDAIELPVKTKYALMGELRRFGYDVNNAPSGIFIRW